MFYYRRFERYFTLLAAFATLFLLACQASFAAPSEVQALKLTQVHNFMGGFNVLVAKDAIRMQSTGQLGFVLVAKAPDWKITVFRTDDKTFYSESLAQLEDTGLFSSFLFTLKERHVNTADFRQSIMKIGNFNVKRLTSNIYTLKFMDLPPKTAPQVERIFYSVYKFPTNGAIPIGYAGIHANSDFLTGARNKGRFEVFLDTSQIEKVMVSPAMFQPPANLKKAASLREVVSGNKSRESTKGANVLWESF